MYGMRGSATFWMAALLLGLGAAARARAASVAAAAATPAAATPVTVNVEMPPIPGNENGAGPEGQALQDHNGYLLRELIRQSVILCLHDELGRATCDPSLFEKAPSDPQAPALRIVYDAPLGQPVHIEIFKGGDANAGDGEKALLALDLPAGNTEVMDYIQLAAGLEAASRNQMPRALAHAGLGKMQRRVSAEALPANVSGLLQDNCILSQFVALRRIHALVDARGESPALLAGLARGYAMLGFLTEENWNPMYKTFEARSLLYAQRLVADAAHRAGPADPLPLFLRAYAGALAGMHAAALADLRSAERRVDAGHPRPAWAPLIEAYCTFDIAALTAAKETQPALATLLKADALFSDRCPSAKMCGAAAEDACQTNDTLRAVDCSPRDLIAVQRGAQEFSMQQIARVMPQRIVDCADVPENVRDFIVDHQGDDALLSPESLLGMRRLIAQAPVDNVLSWQTFARMLLETHFKAVERRADYLRHSQQDLDGARAYINETRALIADHPYADVVKLYGVSPDDPGTYLRLLQGIHNAQPATATLRILAICREDSQFAPDVLQFPVLCHADDVLLDLDAVMINAHSRGAWEPADRRLLLVSPHWDLGAAGLIQSCPELIGQIPVDLAKLEKEFVDRPTFQYQRAAAAVRKGAWQEAAEAYENCARVTGEWWFYQRLAYIYRDHLGMPQKFLPYFQKVMDYFPVNSPYHDFYGHELVAQLVSHGQAREALDLAQRLAGSGDPLDILNASRCEEMLGDYVSAERRLVRLGARSGSDLSWYLFCRRTGKGRLDDARQGLERQIKDREGSAASMFDAGILAQLEGKPADALKGYTGYFSASHDPEAAILGALAALATQDDQTAIALLRRAQSEGRGYFLVDYRSRGGVRTEVMALAGVFQRALENHRLPEERVFTRILSTATDQEDVNLQYDIGAFLSRAGDKQRAREHFTAALADQAGFFKSTFTMATLELRGLPAKPAAAGGGAGGGAGEKGRFFTSKLDLEVWAQTDAGSLPHRIGATTVAGELSDAGGGAAGGGAVAIPPGLHWGVTPLGATTVADLMRESQRQPIPGLKLRIVNPGDLAQAAKIRGLTALDLQDTEVTDADLEQVKAIAGLESLNLRDTRVTDAGLAQLAGLKHLQLLNLQDTGITDAGLELLQELASLQLLDLTGTKVADGGMRFLGRLKQLATLNLGATGVTDAALTRIKDLPALVALDVSRTTVSDAGVRQLAGMKQLTSLDLWSTKVTDAAMATVAGFKNMESLDLTYTAVNDAGLRQISGLKELRELWLERTPITDAGMKQIKGLTALRKLVVGNTAVGDAGLSQLTTLRALQTLDIGGTQATEAGIAALRRALPACDIVP